MIKSWRLTQSPQKSELSAPNPVITWLVPLATTPSLKLSRAKSHLISINPGVVERDLLRITEDAPITFVIGEIPRVLGARDTNQIYISYYVTISLCGAGRKGEREGRKSFGLWGFCQVGHVACPVVTAWKDSQRSEIGRAHV